MAKVVWTDGSIDDLTAIRRYIGQFNPLAAQRMALRLQAASESLADSPNRGRKLGLSRRELAVVPPYIIRYHVEDEAVTILPIRHGARSED